MENSNHNGVRTDHDRHTQVNGINGKSAVGAAVLQEDSGKLAGADSPMTNGKPAVTMKPGLPLSPAGQRVPAAPRSSRMNDLPDEIMHISTEMMPLGLLLSRLAQISHNQLQDVIGELATKSISSVAVNGAGADYRNSSVEDTSPDSLEKKGMLLKFIQGLHAKWVKALVITEWSKRASDVSKLIDLKVHMSEQLRLYDTVLDSIVDVKRELLYARLPSPDLKTALQILRTGKADWMPELNYVDPPPMTLQEQLHWIENLNTLLSVRLSLDDYDRIPFQFRDYSIASGRVTFRVKGEFEVDLTIADEDFEKQFWFIDFRFLFTPAPAELSEALRTFLEARVNEKLATDGLAGCYSFLHEFVLTHKITEFMRQAVELNRGRWIDTLKVERLNRAMSIQYWAPRYPPNGPKSWVILGVHSGRRRDDRPDAKSSSRLSLRWFRDNREVKDVEIGFDTEQISAETLLKTVIARHIEHILTSIHDKLKAKPRFANREAALSLHISQREPMASTLVMELSRNETMTTRIEVITGLFSIEPHSRTFVQGENRLNYQTKDPAEEGFSTLEGIRCAHVNEELNRRGRSMRWSVARVPLRPDELKQIVNTREVFQAVWLKRQGWPPPWYLMMSLSLAGDQWFLVELANAQGSPKITSHMRLPMTPGQPSFSSRFFTNLTVFVTAIISHVTDSRELNARRIHHQPRSLPGSVLPRQVKMPGMLIRLSDIIPQDRDAKARSSRRPWARDYVHLMFKGLQGPSELQRYAEDHAGTAGDLSQARPDSRLGIIADARLSVTDKSSFSLLTGNVGNDVAFNKRQGLFSLQLRADVGQSVIGPLENRLRAIERLVDFLDAIRRRGKAVSCESVTLQEVVFTYTDPSEGGEGAAPASNVRWRARLDLSRGRGIDIILDTGNPHLRILDMLNRLTRTRSGLEMLPFVLPLTLPILRGLDKMEDAWEAAAMNDEGCVEIMHRNLEWLAIRYSIRTAPPPTATTTNNQEDRPERLLVLNVTLRWRRGEMWWHVFRVDAEAASDDEFNVALRAVWESRGEGWRGLATGAAARPDIGIEALLEAMDSAVRALIGKLPPADTTTSSQAGTANTGSMVTTATATTTAAPGMSFSQSSGGGSQQGRLTQLTQPSSQSQGQGGRAGAKAKPTVVVLD